MAAKKILRLACILGFGYNLCDAQAYRKGDDFNFINFARPLENQILIDIADILSQDVVQDGITCAVLCVKDANCQSYNFGAIAGDPNSSCERLRSNRFTPGTTLQNKPGFMHVGLASPCEGHPCFNNTQCIPQFETDGFTCNCTGSGFIGDICDKTDCSVLFDFEDGATDWSRTGSAFSNQPTYGDNSAVRNAGPSNHKGDWWIGTYENRPSSGTTPGQEQGDAPIGTMTSPFFEIKGNTLSFLIGGACNINAGRAELLVDGVVVLNAAGRCMETMAQGTWDVRALRGKRAQLHLVDGSVGGWAHINFDQLEYACP